MRSMSFPFASVLVTLPPLVPTERKRKERVDISVFNFSFLGKLVIYISLFNCVGFSCVGFSNVGFSNVG